MIESCKSERGYTTSARILAITLMTLTNIWVRDYRSVNADEWNSTGASPVTRSLRRSSSLTCRVSAEFRKRSHETWGRLYDVRDVKVEWHVPSPAECDYAIELLRDIVAPLLDKLEALLAQSQEDGRVRSSEWINDFCRVRLHSRPLSLPSIQRARTAGRRGLCADYIRLQFCNAVRSALSGIPSFVFLPVPKEPGEPASDAGCVFSVLVRQEMPIFSLCSDEVPEFIDHLPIRNAGIPLSDPSDPRHQFVVDLRERIGRFLHNAVQTLKSSQQQDTIDCIKMVIASIRVLELDYPCDTSNHATIKKSYEFALNISRVTRNQKLFPRFVWVRRASLYHASRLRLNSFYRRRSTLDDLLIHDLCELSLSVYLAVRRSAQRGLDSIIHYFDGTRTLIYPRLFDALKPGTDHDVMKGALYVLGAKAPQNLAILDWRFGPQYILALLGCQHQDRPSVQNLIRSVTHDFIIRLAEPSTLKNSVDSQALQRSADQVEALIGIAADESLVQRVAEKAKQRIEQKNAAYDQLVRRPLTRASMTPFRQ